jgi:uncharacterized protein YaaW (UPF0174 family)
MANYRNDPDLLHLLNEASSEDISILIDIVTDSGNGRVSLSNDSLVKLVEERDAASPAARLLLAAEIQQFGGNTLISLFRGKGVPYHEIACDVASHVDANYNDNQDITQIETAILLKIVEKSLDKMSEDEKKEFFGQFGITYQGIGPAAMAALITAVRASGFAFYKMTAIIAQATAKALLGRGLTFAATGGLMRGLSVLSGPIGWAITGIWTAFDLASPAYRVTVPCVIQLAYMRQKMKVSGCPACGEPVTKGSKFCAACGHKLA